MTGIVALYIFMLAAFTGYAMTKLTSELRRGADADGQ